jgi:hypothetical protein
LHSPLLVLLHPRTKLGCPIHRSLIRRVKNSSDIGWHKDRVFISEVFRFEDLGFGLVAEDFYKESYSGISLFVRLGLGNVTFLWLGNDQTHNVAIFDGDSHAAERRGASCLQVLLTA